MTKEEAMLIPDLQIHPDELTEDVFYWGMAKMGRISDEHMEKSINRMKKYAKAVPVNVLMNARQMIDNVDKYGVACIDWI